MRVSLGDAFGAACLIGAVLAACATAAAASGPGTPSGAAPCGGGRRAVETLADRAAATVDLSPRTTTVASLQRLWVPQRLGSARVKGIETRTFEVEVRLVQMNLEPDGDVVLAVVDPRSHRTMVVEFPAATCTRRAAQPARRAMSGARAALAAACGRPSSGSVTRVGGAATISGVGFVAPRPHPTDASPNGVGLSPVLTFRMKQCLLGA